MKKLFFVLAGILMPLLLMNCTNAKTGAAQTEAEAEDEAGGLFAIGKPVFEKFVVVNADEGTPIYQKANPNSPTLCRWMEKKGWGDQYQWSDKAVPDDYRSNESMAWAGDLYAVTGEEGDFYKVNLLNLSDDIEAGYILKDQTSDISPEPYTIDLVEEFELDMEYMESCQRVIKEGKYKNLVVCFSTPEINGEFKERLELGVMLDGCIAYPLAGEIHGCSKPDLDKVKLSDEGDYVLLNYPESMVLKQDDGQDLIDLRKLSEDEIGEIVNTMQSRKFDKVRYDFLFPAMGIRSITLKGKSEK